MTELEQKFLAHHGILGQKWGQHNGPPYPIGGSDHSASEKKAGYKKSLNGGHNEKLYNRNSSESKPKEKSEFHLTDQQKKYLKIGAAVAGTALVAYGAYKFQTSPVVKKLVSNGIDAIAKRPSVEDLIAKDGPIIISKKTGEVVKNLPKDLGSVTNPQGLKNNCKDVAEATLKRWLGVDPGAVAGAKTVKGNLHDFVEARGYNKAGVHWINENGSIFADPSGNSADRVIKALLKKFKDGDCGMIGVSWDPKRVLSTADEDGHAFNWLISNGKVTFWDDQPDPPLTDAIAHLRKVDPNKEIEILRLAKEAFA